MAKNTYKLAKDWEDESAAELADSWVNGNRSYVIAKLADCPPNYTALFLWNLFGDDCGQANRTEFNIVCNMLTDSCVEKMGVR